MNIRRAGTDGNRNSCDCGRRDGSASGHVAVRAWRVVLADLHALLDHLVLHNRDGDLHYALPRIHVRLCLAGGVGEVGTMSWSGGGGINALVLVGLLLGAADVKISAYNTTLGALPERARTVGDAGGGIALGRGATRNTAPIVPSKSARVKIVSLIVDGNVAIGSSIANSLVWVLGSSVVGNSGCVASRVLRCILSAAGIRNSGRGVKLRGTQIIRTRACPNKGQ